MIRLAALLALILGQSEEPAWELVAQDSTLTFAATYDDTPFDGVFETFDVEFRFDPEAADEADLRVTVDVRSVDTRNRDVDEALADPEWFDFSAHPQATYVASGAGEGKNRAFRMAGDLTIKGITRTIPIEFDWTVEGDSARVTGTARMRGDTEVNRLDFDVGTGEWEDPIVGHRVEVNFDLRLKR
ncbi:MAG: YceI family protein [Xanthomonadales bacterium]|nr:YceI family protein [Xanthomonadales bacterium]